MIPAADGRPGCSGPGPAGLADAMAAGAAAALLSGLPSTVHAVATGHSALEASLAAGSVLLPGERRSGRLLAAAALLHLVLSLGWAGVLSLVLRRRAGAGAGALGGLLIAALDLGLLGRRFPRVRALPPMPQVADHLAYGAVVGGVLRRRRRARAAAGRAQA